MDGFTDSLWTYRDTQTRPGHVTSFISDEVRIVFTVLNNGILTALISLFGMVTNIINMIIFYHQGLDTTINISFFILAFSDLCGLIVQQWYSVCVNPLWDNSEVPANFKDLIYLTAGVPRETFARITCLITAYITAERCLCIAFPLKVKQMITPRRTAITLITMYAVTLISFLPLYCTSFLDWKFIPNLNRTVIGLIQADNTDLIESATFIMHSLFGFLSFLAVIIFTLILIRKLGQKGNFRKVAANIDQEKGEAMSVRDRKTITMIVLIATVLIVSYTPAVLLCVVTFFEPEFIVKGKYFNEFQVSWSFAFLLEGINSSANIFLYFKMSSKYRQALGEVFQNCGIRASKY